MLNHYLTATGRILAVIAAALPALFLAACQEPDRPEDVAVGYYASFAQGDMDTAWNYIHVPDTIDQQDQEAVDGINLTYGKLKELAAKAKEQADSHGGIQGVAAVSSERLDLKAGPERMVVTVEVTANDGTVITDRVNLIKTEDDWKVDIFSRDRLVELFVPGQVMDTYRKIFDNYMDYMNKLGEGETQ